MNVTLLLLVGKSWARWASDAHLCLSVYPVAMQGIYLLPSIEWWPWIISNVPFDS